MFVFRLSLIFPSKKNIFLPSMSEAPTVRRYITIAKAALIKEGVGDENRHKEAARD
jgi:hypothetical protein